MSDSERNKFLLSGKVIRKLPDRRCRCDRLPTGLVGSEIVDFGALEDARMVEGGGLVIAYRPAGSDRIRRVVFGFNELGMWVEAIGRAGPRLGDRNPASQA